MLSRGSATLIGGPHDGETITPNAFMARRIIFVGDYEQGKPVKYGDEWSRSYPEHVYEIESTDPLTYRFSHTEPAKEGKQPL